MTDQQLYASALAAAENAYAPYSGFRVGAALRTKGGKLYTGANIENASYGVTVCAERTALFSAVLDGARNFDALAVAAVDRNGNAVSAPPCGVCRQALSEFDNGSLRIVFGTAEDLQCVRLRELLPHGFSLE
jgi:cytidine deaminase